MIKSASENDRMVVWRSRGRLPGEEGLEGGFTPRRNGRQHLIEIFRSWQLYPNLPIFELCSLAHEYGHYMSYLAVSWPEGYPVARYLLAEDPGLVQRTA